MITAGQPFRMLSLDGGGIRGVFSAAVLAAIEEDTGKRIADHFDLVVGTSTGGIIAIGLGLGLSPKEILQFYLNHGPAIFPKRPRWRRVRRLVSAQYSAEPLERAVQDVFGQRVLGESQKRLVIPSYNLGKDDIYLFKTAHHDRLRRDWMVPAWRVARATSAAPTYLPAFTGYDSLRLIDGGVWANNPLMIGLVEAVSVLRVELHDICALSLGTVSAIQSRPKSLDRGGLWQWKAQAPEVLMRANSIGVTGQAQLLLSGDALLRFDVDAPDKLVSLDDIGTVDDLIGLARHSSRHIVPEVAARFLDEIAPKFVPRYGPGSDTGDSV